MAHCYLLSTFCATDNSSCFMHFVRRFHPGHWNSFIGGYSLLRQGASGWPEAFGLERRRDCRPLKSSKLLAEETYAGKQDAQFGRPREHYAASFEMYPWPKQCDNLWANGWWDCTNDVKILVECYSWMLNTDEPVIRLGSDHAERSPTSHTKGRRNRFYRFFPKKQAKEGI